MLERGYLELARKRSPIHSGVRLPGRVRFCWWGWVKERRSRSEPPKASPVVDWKRSPLRMVKPVNHPYIRGSWRRYDRRMVKPVNYPYIRGSWRRYDCPPGLGSDQRSEGSDRSLQWLRNYTVKDLDEKISPEIKIQLPWYKDFRLIIGDV